MRYFIPAGTRVGVSNGRPNMLQAIFSETTTNNDAWFETGDLMSSPNPNMLFFRLPDTQTNLKCIGVDIKLVKTRNPYTEADYALENESARIAEWIDQLIGDTVV